MRFLLVLGFLVSGVVCHTQTFEEYISSFSDRDMQMNNYHVFQVFDRGITRYFPGGYEVLEPRVYGSNNYSDVINTVEYVAPDNIFVASFNIPRIAKIKRFNGVEWQDFPSLPEGAMSVSDILYRSENEIYVAAQNRYTRINLVYKYDGNQWIDTNMVPFLDYEAQLFYISATEIYATVAGQTAVYNGQQWSILEQFGITTQKIYIDVVDADHKYVTGRSQLMNFATGTSEPVGNILLAGESPNDVTVTHVQAIAQDDIYIAAKIYVGFSNATFVSHWDGTNWERLWTFDPSNQVDDHPTYLFEEDGNIFVKIVGRPMFAYLPNFVDDDGDGVVNSEDTDPNDPFVCRDLDADGCDDCSQTGSNGSGGSITNDGDDFDNDGICDYGDEDDDNDGQRDIDEIACGSDPFDANSMAADLDGDSIPDCVDDDIDGDGFSNDEEIACGSDPYDPTETCDTVGIGGNIRAGLKLFPNPSSGIYRLEGEASQIKLGVYSLSGRKILTLDAERLPMELDLGHLASGIYLLKIETVQGNIIKKLVRE